MPANLERFLAGFGEYGELYRWSLARPEEFWPAVWRFCGVKATRRWDDVVDEAGLRWFPGAELNFAATLLRPQDDAPALTCAGRRSLTHRDFYLEVARTAQALQAAGVRAGDRVASCLPAIPETVIALLATAALGAVWTPWPLGDGAAPKILFGTDRPSMDELKRRAAALPSLQQVIVVALAERSPDLRGLRRALRWQDFTAFYQGCREVPFRRLGFHHPLLLEDAGAGFRAYPAGGLLLQFLKETALHFDVRPTTRIRIAEEAGTASLVRAVTALARGATLELGAPGGWPEAALPAARMLPNPLDPTGAPVPALGVNALGDAVQAPCPSLPVNWP